MLVCLGLKTPVVEAAEQLESSFHFVEISVPIQELEIYAYEGQATGRLATYLTYLTSTDRQRLRQFLLQRIQFSRLEMGQLWHTPSGSDLLRRVAQVIRPPSGAGRFYALRSALTMAAPDCRRLSSTGGNLHCLTTPKDLPHAACRDLPAGIPIPSHLPDADCLTVLNILRQFPTRRIYVDWAAVMDILNSLEQRSQAIQAMMQAITSAAVVSAPSTLDSSLAFTGPLTYKVLSLNWVDQSAKRLAYTKRARRVVADLYLPDLHEQQSRSVVVLSHGFGADRGTFAYLAEHLASYGFVAIVLEHMGSNTQLLVDVLAGHSRVAIGRTEFLDRPLDVTFLLDQLEQLAQVDPRFKGLNLTQVGIMGHSTGGYTALTLAGAELDLARLQQICPAQLQTSLNLSLFLQCQARHLPLDRYALQDERIGAIATTQSMQRTLLGHNVQHIKVPVLVFSGTNDRVTPALEEQICPFTWLTTPHKYLLLVNGGGHFMTSGRSQTQPNPLKKLQGLFGDGGRTLASQQYLKAFSTAFFKTHIAQDPMYHTYLTAPYAKVLSQPSMSLTFASAFPNHLLQTCDHE